MGRGERESGGETYLDEFDEGFKSLVGTVREFVSYQVPSAVDRKTGVGQ
jgi:hypothetical protein